MVPGPSSMLAADRVAASAARGQAPVAQLDRALPSEGRGREFESRRVRHFCVRFYARGTVQARIPIAGRNGGSSSGNAAGT